MVNYQQGKIYKIVCNITGEVYVGSTCMPTLAKRLADHRSDLKRFNDGKMNNIVSSFKIIERGNYYIDLLESYPCSSRDELLKKEREYFDKIECVNKYRPYITREEHREQALKNNREYQQDNCGRLKETHKQYYIDNRDVLIKNSRVNYREKREQINEERKKKYEENKDIINEKRRIYREKNKDKINEYGRLFHQRRKLKKQNAENV